MNTTRRVLTWVGAGGVVIAVIAGFVLLSPKPNPLDRYRTALVANGSVERVLTLTGAVERSDQVTASFDTAGTVTSVSVEPGDKVNAGQPLARIDSGPLRLAVLEAQAQLAQANAQLYSQQHPKAITIPGGAGNAAAQQAAAKAAAAQQAAAKAAAAKQAQASAKAMAGVQRGLAAVRKALAAQQKACAPLLVGGGRGAKPSVAPSASPTDGSPAPGGGPSSGPSIDPSAIPSGQPSGGVPTGRPSGPAPALIAKCTKALAAVAMAEQQTAAALIAGSKLMAGAGAPAGSSGAGGAASGGTSGGSAQLPSAATTTPTVDAAAVKSARAQVLQAQQAVGRAEENLANATLTAPIEGTIGAVTLAEGAGSLGRSITIVGVSSAKVSIEVPLTKRPDVAIGQAVSLAPTGSQESVTGKITGVNTLSTPGTSGNPTYTATVIAADPDQLLASGSRATTTITVKQLTDVPCLPVSALTRLSENKATARILGPSGDVRDVTVTTGLIGRDRVEIRDGLAIGDRVVVADRQAPLPQYNPFTRRPATAAAGSTSPSPTARRS